MGMDCRWIWAMASQTSEKLNIQYSSTPVLQHSSTPVLQHSSTPVLQYSSTPALLVLLQCLHLNFVLTLPVIVCWIVNVKAIIESLTVDR